jgi:hypothetical protein
MTDRHVTKYGIVPLDVRKRIRALNGRGSQEIRKTVIRRESPGRRVVGSIALRRRSRDDDETSRISSGFVGSTFVIEKSHGRVVRMLISGMKIDGGSNFANEVKLKTILFGSVKW